MRWLLHAARASVFLAVFSLTLFGCGASASQNPPETQAIDLDRPGALIAADDSSASSPEGAIGEEGGDPGPIPVTRDDPSWGSPLAPVTIVQFSDFECPYCQRSARTLAELQQIYGPGVLRVVWKNNPLPFHKNARPASELAMVAFAERGPSGFSYVYDGFFGDPGARPSPESLARLAGELGYDRDRLDALAERYRVSEKVDADMALAMRIGARATPTFFINGQALQGAQPLVRFRAIIDDELVRASALIERGVSPSRVYATRTAENLDAAGDGALGQRVVTAADTEVYVVPVGSSPVLGKSDALVTLVVFNDLQCPYCARSAPTLAQLLVDYRGKVRIVWKHLPLAFHPRAEPAAELAEEARAQRGELAFWKVVDMIFSDNKRLEDSDFLVIARGAGLDEKRAMAAVATHQHSSAIAADMKLAEKLGARGTPTFFINGRKLVGARPLADFKALIDEQIAEAERMIRAGTPPSRIYETIQSGAARAKPAAVIPRP